MVVELIPPSHAEDDHHRCENNEDKNDSDSQPKIQFEDLESMGTSLADQRQDFESDHRQDARHHIQDQSCQKRRENP